MSNKPTQQWPRQVDNTEERLTRIERGVESLLRGQADLTVAFGRIWRRVQVLERDAKWKTWAMRVARVVLPAAGGFAAAKFPALASLINDIVQSGLAP